MGTMTLGSVSLTKAFDAAPHNWFPPLTFALVLAVGASCSLQQKSHRRRRLMRKPIHAAVGVYWNNQLYRGSATEMGTQSIRVEVDERIQGIKRLMPVGLVFKQEHARPSQRLLAQIISIASEGNHRSVLELRFPDRWQQQQNRKVQYLLNTLH
jgi:cellulose synthase (UDP-forming)